MPCCQKVLLLMFHMRFFGLDRAAAWALISPPVTLPGRAARLARTGSVSFSSWLARSRRARM